MVISIDLLIDIGTVLGTIITIVAMLGTCIGSRCYLDCSECYKALHTIW